MAAILRAQSPQELCAATQRESIFRQRQVIFSAAHRGAPASGAVAEGGELRAPPGGAPRTLAPGLRGLGASPAPAAQLDSVQQQRAAVARQKSLSIAGAPSPAVRSLPLPPQEAAPPAPQQELRHDAMASSNILLQIQSVALQPRPSPPEPPLLAFSPSCAALPESSLSPIFERAATSYGIASSLLRAVARKESAFQPCAISRAGALGLMQLMPETAATLGVEDPFDPEQNILGGARYLRLLLDRFDNSLSLALGAYNAGPARIEAYGGIPPFRETREYVTSILSRLPGADGSRPPEP